MKAELPGIEMWLSARFTWVALSIYLAWVFVGMVTGWNKITTGVPVASGRAVFEHTVNEHVTLRGDFLIRGPSVSPFVRRFVGDSDLVARVAAESPKRIEMLVEFFDAYFLDRFTLENRRTGTKQTLTGLYERRKLVRIDLETGTNVVRLRSTNPVLRYRIIEFKLIQADAKESEGISPDKSVRFTSVKNMPFAVGAGWGWWVPFEEFDPQLIPAVAPRAHLQLRPSKPGRYQVTLPIIRHSDDYPVPNVTLNGQRIVDVTVEANNGERLVFTADLQGDEIVTFEFEGAVRGSGKSVQGGEVEFPIFNVRLGQCELRRVK